MHVFPLNYKTFHGLSLYYLSDKYGARNPGIACEIKVTLLGASCLMKISDSNSENKECSFNFPCLIFSLKNDPISCHFWILPNEL